MATSIVYYQGDLRTESTHLQSGESYITDAPTDNEGKAEAFSPTDLIATGLANCMLTIMGIAAQSHGFNIDGSSVNAEKIMGKNPRRVSEIHLDISIKGLLTEKQREILMKAAKHCPVSKSIHPEIKENISFNFTE